MTYRYVIRGAAVLLVVVLTLSACASDDEDGAGSSTTSGQDVGLVSLADAATAADGTTLTVEGVLFVSADGIRLCGAIGESYPVQCLGDSVPVTGVDPGDHAMGDGGPGIEISAGPVTVEGTMEQGTLVAMP